MRDFRFHKFQNLDQILVELKSRLPASCNVLNMIKFYPKFKNEMKLYVLSSNTNKLETAWILILHQLENEMQQISISVPKEPFATFSQIQVKDAFVTSDLLDWKRPYRFCAVDPKITQIFLDLCFFEKGHILKLFPNALYYMDEEALKNLCVRTTPITDKITLKSLNDEAGLDFIMKTWRYATSGAENVISRLLQRNFSSGVYLEGKPISGVVQNQIGLLGMLHTLEDFRNKGYAQMCMLHAVKELTEQGFVPATCVDAFNDVSKAFQIRLGFKELSDVVHYIFKDVE